MRWWINVKILIASDLYLVNLWPVITACVNTALGNLFHHESMGVISRSKVCVISSIYQNQKAEYSASTQHQFIMHYIKSLLIIRNYYVGQHKKKSKCQKKRKKKKWKKERKKKKKTRKEKKQQFRVVAIVQIRALLSLSSTSHKLFIVQLPYKLL